MKKKLSEITSEISSYLRDYKKDELISFLVNNSETGSCEDANLSLSLLFDKVPLAKIGISYGLKDYYRLEDFCGIDFYSPNDPLVLNAIKRANKKWGVTLMQSFPGKKNLREKFSKTGSNYKHFLMNEMTSLSKKFDFPIEFYLPGKLVFWNLNSLNQEDFFQCKGRYEVFRENYDSVAKKFGFQLSPDDSLYER